jgi:hypothetical protein
MAGRRGMKKCKNPFGNGININENRFPAFDEKTVFSLGN